jgi:serine/threonine protein kinase
MRTLTTSPISSNSSPFGKTRGGVIDILKKNHAASSKKSMSSPSLHKTTTEVRSPEAIVSAALENDIQLVHNDLKVLKPLPVTVDSVNRPLKLKHIIKASGQRVSIQELAHLVRDDWRVIVRSQSSLTSPRSPIQLQLPQKEENAQPYQLSTSPKSSFLGGKPGNIMLGHLTRNPTRPDYSPTTPLLISANPLQPVRSQAKATGAPQPKPRALKIHATNEHADVIGTMSKPVYIGKEYTLFKNDRIEEQYKSANAPRKLSEMILTRETQIVQLHFGNISFENVNRDEPLFGFVEFYNVRKGEKVSETFRFDLPMEQKSEPSVVSFQIVEKPSRDLYVVVWIERILGDQTVDKLIPPYMTKQDRSKAKPTQQREIPPHLMDMRQKVLFSFLPMYEGTNPENDKWDETVGSLTPPATSTDQKRKSVFDIFKISKPSTPPSSPPRQSVNASTTPVQRGSSSLGSFGNAGSFRESTTITSPTKGRSGSVNSTTSGRSNSASTPRGTGNPILLSSPSSGKMHARASTTINSARGAKPPIDAPAPIISSGTNRKSMKDLFNRLSVAFTGKSAETDSIRVSRSPDEDSEEEVPTEEILLREGGLKFTQFYPVPQGKDLISHDVGGRYQRHALVTFDVCQFILQALGGKISKSAPGVLQLTVRNITNSTLNKLQERMTTMKMKQMGAELDIPQLMNFTVLKKPVAQVSYIHNLYVYPERLDASKMKGKARNLLVKVMFLENDDTKTVSSARPHVIIGRDTANNKDTAVTYHDPKPYFHDEVKIQLPLQPTPKHHLLFLFYHVTCGGKILPRDRIPTKQPLHISKDKDAYDDRVFGDAPEILSNMSVTEASTLEGHSLLGYSVLSLGTTPDEQTFLRTQRIELPLVTSSVVPSGYLSKAVTPHSANSDTSIFTVSTRVISNVHIGNLTVNNFIQQCDILEETDEPLSILRNIIDIMQKTINHEHHLQDLLPNLYLLLNVTFRIMVYVYHSRTYDWKLGEHDTALVDKFFTQAMEFQLALMRRITDTPAPTANANGGKSVKFNPFMGLIDREIRNENDLLRRYIDFVFDGYVIASGGSVTTLHDVICDVWPVAIRSENSQREYYDLYYFLFEVVYKSIALYVNDKRYIVNDQEKTEHLKKLEPAMHLLVRSVTSEITDSVKSEENIESQESILSQVFAEDTIRLKMRASSGSKATAQFIQQLFSLFDFEFVRSLTKRAYIDVFFDRQNLQTGKTLVMNKQRMRMLIEGIKVFALDKSFLIINAGIQEKSVDRHMFSNLILESIDIVFEYFPALRSKILTLFATHLYELDAQIENLKSVRQYVAHMYFPFLDFFVRHIESLMNSNGEEEMKRDDNSGMVSCRFLGIKNAVVSLVYLLDNASPKIFRDWVASKCRSPNQLRAFIQIAHETKMTLSQPEMDMSLLKHVNTLLEVCYLENSVKCLQDTALFTQTADFLAFQYLKQYPTGELFRFLPIVLETFIMAYMPYVRKRQVCEEWVYLTGELIKFTQYPHYRHVMSLYLKPYESTDQNDDLIKVITNQVYVGETQNAAYVNLFLEVYMLYMPSMWLLKYLAFQMFLKPRRTVAVLEAWLDQHQQLWTDDTALNERLQYHLTAHLNLFTSKENEDYIPRVHDLLKTCRLYYEDGLKGEHSGNDVPLLPKSKGEERYNKLVDMFAECNLHTEVLKIIVYQLKDGKQAIDYCKRVYEQHSHEESPFLTLLDIALAPKKYGMAESYADHSIAEMIAEDHYAMLDADKMLEVIDVKQLSIDMLKKLLRNKSNNYETTRYLGKGAQGAVLLAKRKKAPTEETSTEETPVEEGVVAIKMIYLNNDIVARACLSEVQTMIRSIKNDHVVKYIDFFLTELSDSVGGLALSTNVACIVMEYCAGGDLLGFMQHHLQIRHSMKIKGTEEEPTKKPKKRDRGPNVYTIEEEIILQIIKHMATGLEHLHSQDIIHRDLKPQNILIGVNPGAAALPTEENYKAQNNIYKIADFGLSKLLQSNWNTSAPSSLVPSPRGERGSAKSVSNSNGSGLSTQSVVGSMNYISPEASKGYWYKAPTDIWSLGCILFELLTLMIAQKDLKVLISMSRNYVRQTMESQKLHHRYSSKVLYILENCLKLDPMARITAKQILTVLHLHPAEVDELLKESRQFDEEYNTLVSGHIIPVNDNPEKDDTEMQDSDPTVDRMFHSGSSVANIYQKVLFNQDSLHLFRLKRPVTPVKITDDTEAPPEAELTYPLLERHNVEKLVHYLIFCENPTRKIRNPNSFPFRKYYDQFNNLSMSSQSRSRTKKEVSIIDRINMTDTSFFNTDDDEGYDSLTDDNTTTTTWVHDDEDDDDDEKSSKKTKKERALSPVNEAEDIRSEEGGELLFKSNSIETITDPVQAEHVRKMHRRHQRTLFLTLHYFTNPVVILKNLIEIARRQPSDNPDMFAMREQCLQCIVSWVNNGNLCYDYNPTISKLLRYTLRIQIGNNPSAPLVKEGANNATAELERSLHDKRMRLLSKNLRSTLMTKLTKLAEARLLFGLIESGRTRRGLSGAQTNVKEVTRDRTSLTNVTILRMKMQEASQSEDNQEIDEEDGYMSDGDNQYNLSGLPAIMTYPEVEIVEQMTLLDQEMFKQIKPFEWSRVQLMNLNNDLKHRYDHSPNLLKTIIRFNRVGRWVCTCIIRERDLEARVALVAKFIRMVDSLFNKYRNLNTTKAILFGLNYSAVQRLTETWDEVAKQYPKESESFKRISDILESNESTDSMMSIDLEKFDKIEEKGNLTAQSQKELDAILGNPCVPFIGTYLSLLKTIEVEEYSFLDEVVEHDTREVVNMPKFEKMADCIREIQLHQRKDYYDCPKINSLFKKLKSIDNTAVIENRTALDEVMNDNDDIIYSDNLLYLDSLLIEPVKEGTAPPSRRTKTKLISKKR